MARLLIAIVFILTCFLPNIIFADEKSRPLSEDGPTTVKISAVLIDIDEINSANQSFVANIYLGFRWMDPRLKSENSTRRRVELNEIWHPEVQVLNPGGKISKETIVKVSPEGEVNLIQRFYGPFSNPLDLEDFPLDAQKLRLQFASVVYGPKEVAFVKNEKSPSEIAENFSFPDWDINNWRDYTDVYLAKSGAHTNSMFIFELNVDRKVGYYILKVILPLVLIVTMSLVVFWIDPSLSASQISVSTTSMLTLIAYRFMIDSSLPRISYLTRMDIFILSATVLVFLTLLIAVYTAWLFNKDKLMKGRRIDRVCRYVFPLLFIIMCYISFVGPII